MNSKTITLKDVKFYIESFRKCTIKISLSVMLCIISPVVLIVLSGVSESTHILSSKFSNIVGVLFIVVMLILAIILSLKAVLEINKNDFYKINKNSKYILENGISEYISDLKQQQKKKFSSKIIICIALCIVFAIPVIITGMFYENIAIYECIASSAFLIAFAVQVAYFIYFQINFTCYEKFSNYYSL